MIDYNHNMKLKNKIKNIANELNIQVNDKSIYTLNKFINELHINKSKSFDFNSLVKNIKSNYILKSAKSEKFFIENLAHTIDDNNENIFDFKSLDISKNFNETISPSKLEHLENRLKNTEFNDSEIVDTLNNLSNFTHKLNSDFIENLDSKYSFKKLAKVKYLDYKNLDKTPVMLTFTPDENYRKYKKVNPNIDGKLGEFENLKLIEKNKELYLQELIEDSYNYLNAVFRKFYQHTKTLNMRQGLKDKLDYILIFEPNKSLTLHLHVLIYCNDIQLDNLSRSWDNYLKDLTDKQLKGQDKKIIDRTRATGATYVSKYLIKEYNKDTEKNEKNFYLQYRRFFSKFKLFRTSNFYYTSQAKIDKMYSYLYKNYPDLLDDIRKSDTSIYVVLEELDKEDIFEFETKKQDSISFSREEIKEFFEKNKNNLDDKILKEQIVDIIGSFMSKIKIQKIYFAKFKYSYEVLVKIFNKYRINSSNITNESIQFDKFYYENMYKFKKLSTNKSINISNSMLL